jgi:hypothetical protein
VLCVRNDECEDLERRKVYRVLADEKAEKDGYLRMIDESGDDYLYPASYLSALNYHTKRNKPWLIPSQARAF